MSVKKLISWLWVAVMVIINIIILDLSFMGISTPDDFAVFLGIVGLGVVVFGVFLVIKLIIKINKFKNDENESV